ncbi:heavy-metal-associated domain-containing protein [archaeon]|jgi:uncharacterized protein|nr:heavy-metal-associated domain-containing protein [archaeon]MBT6824040.1 heavy-metal-associated domain-containing protein [archaeon]MBT7107273.1 heavy-metal-associated domain-containing protein [archaeon]MBT7297194.1 heavy-metal-associated domain-containing protein [archaeon]
MKNVILKVEGMHCKSCEIILKEELENISGVVNVIPNHKKDIIELNFNGSNETLNVVRALIIKEGYKI